MNSVEKRGWPVSTCVFVCMREHESEGGREGREVVGERGGRREEEAVTAITV